MVFIVILLIRIDLEMSMDRCMNPTRSRAWKQSNLMFSTLLIGRWWGGCWERMKWKNRLIKYHILDDVNMSRRLIWKLRYPLQDKLYLINIHGDEQEGVYLSYKSKYKDSKGNQNFWISGNPVVFEKELGRERSVQGWK